MRRIAFCGLLAGTLSLAGSGLDVVAAVRAIAPSGYLPGQRVLVDAHNAYPSDGEYANRIDRALRTGLPVAIEQDLVWYVDPRSGVGRTVVSHGGSDAATAPTFEKYFFEKLEPIMKKALAENRRDDWPLVTLNLDFKTNEPEHHAAVWALLGKYESWLTTAERTATPATPASLRLGPMLVLTGSNDQQQVSFHDKVAVGERLRAFGAIADAQMPGANTAEKAKNYVAMAPAVLIPSAATNYRRWANFPWAAVEAGGQPSAAEWTADDAGRLKALVDRAHAMQLWIRFYTLNGHSKEESQGWSEGYNFGSPAAVAKRWSAAIAAGVDFLATDQYEALARMKKD
jgi:hypothetical protein